MNAKFVVLRIGRTKFEKKKKNKNKKKERKKERKKKNQTSPFSLIPKKVKGQPGMISSPKAVKIVSMVNCHIASASDLELSYK